VDFTPGTRDELAAEVAALERALDRAASQAQEAEERVAALVDEKAEAEGKAKLARLAVVDFEQRIVEQREALAAAEGYERACQAVDAVMEQRDAAAQRVATAVHQLLASLDELATLRAELATLHRDLARSYGRNIPRLKAEPAELGKAWTALRERLKDEIDRNLDEELLEAAASAPFAWAVDQLPEHLREAGRRRWRDRRENPSPT
jgi:chromosome segregation ATPase